MIVGKGLVEIQDEVERLTVRIVKGEEYTSESEDDVRLWLRRFIGDGMRFEVQYISERDLLLDDTGRPMPVVSRVPLW